MSEMAPERRPLGRIGDDVYDPILVRCEGCGESLVSCDADWWTDTRACCGTCTHIRRHPSPEQVEG